MARFTLGQDTVIEIPKDHVEYSDEQVHRRSVPRIAVPYLLVVEQTLPLYRNSEGQLFADALWQKDLLMHLDYIDHLIVASPCHGQAPPREFKPLPEGRTTFNVIELPTQKSFFGSVKAMPKIVARLISAIRKAGVVHTAIAGWPIPMGWIAAPIAFLLRKPLVVVVESAPWRIQKGHRGNWKRRLRAALQERIGRLILRNATLVICTQDEYRQSLVGLWRANGFVIPASWVDEQDILPTDVAEDLWDDKLSSFDSRLRILFVGRLVADKGILLLLQAMQQLDGDSAAISLDILGGGDLKGECESTAATLTGRTSINLIGTVPYGPALFDLIRKYDAVVVPNISDEQPRIVFDAYSQAVPILARDTPGLRSCVKDGESGLFAPGKDAASLASLLKHAAMHRSQLRQLGLQSLEYARTMTHQEMHRQRAFLLREMLDKQPSTQSS